MLRDRALAGLVGAQGLSRVGSELTFLALTWFVLTTTGSPARASSWRRRTCGSCSPRPRPG